MITVMVIDDHAFVRTALRRLLEDDPNVKVLGEAGTGEEALLMARKIKPDVALLDVDLPDLTGMEIAQRLLQRQDVRHIIVITAFASDIYSRRILRMGVGGYLLKESEPQQLLEAIHRVYHGKQYLSPKITEQLALRSTSNEPFPLDVLTNSELELAILTARGDKTKRIAEKLHVAPKTINSYRRTILKKLGLRNSVDLIHLVLEYGLIQRETLE